MAFRKYLNFTKLMSIHFVLFVLVLGFKNVFYLINIDLSFLLCIYQFLFPKVNFLTPGGYVNYFLVKICLYVIRWAHTEVTCKKCLNFPSKVRGRVWSFTRWKFISRDDFEKNRYPVGFEINSWAFSKLVWSLWQLSKDVSK